MNKQSKTLGGNLISVYGMWGSAATVNRRTNAELKIIVEHTKG